MWFGGNTAVMNNATKLENSEKELVHHALMLTEPFTGLLSVSLGTRADTVRVLNPTLSVKRPEQKAVISSISLSTAKKARGEVEETSAAFKSQEIIVFFFSIKPVLFF